MAAQALLIGENTVTLREQGTSHISVANILGRETHDGQEHIYLDRLIHYPGLKPLQGWTFQGVVSTILVASASPSHA